MMIKRLNSYVQINDKFFIRKGEFFEETKGKSIKISGFEKMDFFLHYQKIGKKKLWMLSDGISGCLMSKKNKSLKKVIENAENFLNLRSESQVEQKIRNIIENKYISPRYSFVVNPNSVYYVESSKNKNKKSDDPRRYRIHFREE